MDTNITHDQVEIKHVGLAIECGTLDVLLHAVLFQPVLLMPLTRTVQQGTITAQQWCVHLTSRPSTTSPVYYATFRAAEVVTQRMGNTLTAPYPQPIFQRSGEDVVQLALCLQASLVACLHQSLTRSASVTMVCAPSRYRLPDAWVWSAQSTDPHLLCEQGGMWSLTSDPDVARVD